MCYTWDSCGIKFCVPASYQFSILFVKSFNQVYPFISVFFSWNISQVKIKTSNQNPGHFDINANSVYGLVYQKLCSNWQLLKLNFLLFLCFGIQDLIQDFPLLGFSLFVISKRTLKVYPKFCIKIFNILLFWANSVLKHSPIHKNIIYF